MTLSTLHSKNSVDGIGIVFGFPNLSIFSLSRRCFLAAAAIVRSRMLIAEFDEQKRAVEIKINRNRMTTKYGLQRIRSHSHV